TCVRRPALPPDRRLIRCRTMRMGFTAWIVAVAACGAGADAMVGANSDVPSSPSDKPAETPIEIEDAAPPPEERPGPAVSYAAAVQRSVHNAYERLEPLLDQLVFHRVRSIELDVHSGKEGATAPSGEWLVYHDDVPFFRNTSCTTLTDC